MNLIKEFMENPLFSIGLSVMIFELFSLINKKTKLAILNPLLLTIGFMILLLKLCSIPFNTYNEGGQFISMFLAPATAALGLSIFRQFPLLKKNLIPALTGCLAGALTSTFSVHFLCKLFQIDESLRFSLLPKSVTTPIAMEISSQLSGIPSITVAAVVITGILGSILCPYLIKIFRIDNATIAGVSIGACSHAVGTSKAVELGDVEGAMSGIAIGISGIITVILALIFF